MLVGRIIILSLYFFDWAINPKALEFDDTQSQYQMDRMDIDAEFSGL